ncbi:Hypothetical protein YALI2_A00122g [Yarrowia lipolytica]|nr:Hypothetical protein YALI2_A00122g [Yarrowia lipolytica]
MPLCDSHRFDSHDQSAWISLGNGENPDPVPQLPEVPELAPIRFSRMNFEVYSGWKPDKQVIDERADPHETDSHETDYTADRDHHRHKSLRSLQSLDSLGSSSDSLSLPSLPSFASTISDSSLLGICDLDSHSLDSPQSHQTHVSNDTLVQTPSNSHNYTNHSTSSLSHLGDSQKSPAALPSAHSLRKTKSTSFDHSSLQPWELSEDEYNAYKMNALKQIKNRRRQEGKLPTTKKHKHRPPRILVPQSPPKLQLISPLTPTLASAPPSQPPPKLPLPSLAAYTRMQSSQTGGCAVRVDAPNTTHRNASSCTDLTDQADNTFDTSVDFQDASTFFTTSSSPASASPPTSPLSASTASMRGLQKTTTGEKASSEDKKDRRLISRPMKAFRAAWDGKPDTEVGSTDSAGPDNNPRLKEVDSPIMPRREADPSPDKTPPPDPSPVAPGNPDMAATNCDIFDTSPNPPPSQTLLPQTAVASEQPRVGGNNRSEAELDATPTSDAHHSTCDDPISNEPFRDILEDTHSSDFSDDNDCDNSSDIQDTDATGQDMNGHPRRVSSLSSTTSMRSLDKSRDKPTKDSRELHQLSSITKGLVKNSPFFDLDENRAKSGPRASVPTKGLKAKVGDQHSGSNRNSRGDGDTDSNSTTSDTTNVERDISSAGTNKDTNNTGKSGNSTNDTNNKIDPTNSSSTSTSTSTIKLVQPMHDPSLQQRGSSLRAGAGRSHPDSSTDSVDSFKSTKEIPREFAPDSPPSTSQISTPKKESTNHLSSSVFGSATREPKDDPDQEDFSFVDHSDSVKRSGHKPWDKDDPRVRRSILAEFESDLNDLLLLSKKSPDGEDMHDLEFDPEAEPDANAEAAEDRDTHTATRDTPSHDTIIPVAPPGTASSASTSTTTASTSTSPTPITIPTTADVSEHALGSVTTGIHPTSVSPNTATTSPTSPTYMDAPPPPPADPMPTTPGEALDAETLSRGKKAPSIASTSTTNTSASTPLSLNANKRGLRSVSSSASLKLRTSIFPFKGPASAGVATTPETASMTGSMYSSNTSMYSSGSTLVRDSPAVIMAKTRMRTSLKSFPILYYAVTLSGPVNVKYNIEGATPSGQYGILSLPTAPHPWEKPPEDLALRGVWFLRLVVDSGTNTAGGFLTDKLFVPRDVWSLSTSMSAKVLDKRLYITDEYCRAICEFMAFADSSRTGVKGQSSSAQSIDDALERLDARIDNLSRHQYVLKADGDLIIDLGANSPDSDDTLTPLASSVPSESALHPVMSHPTPSTTPMTSNNRRSSDIGLLANHIFSKKEEKPKEDKDNSSSKLFKRFQRKISLANNHSNENLSISTDKSSNGRAEAPPRTPIDPHHDYGARYFNAISALYSDMEALAHYRFLLQNEARDSQAAKGYSQAVIVEAIDSCFAFSNTICRIILQDVLAMLEVYLEGGKAVLSD